MLYNTFIMSSGESYFQQLQDAKNSTTDSFDYQQRVEVIDEQRKTAAIERTRGCLVGDCALNGFSSGTPLECPVESCDATFDKNALKVNGAADCASPIYKPQPLHPSKY